jgi:SagB-type dehydrogenase family enzyme
MAATTDTELSLQLRPDATAEPVASESRVRMAHGPRRVSLGPLAPGVLEAVCRLADGGAAERELCDAAGGDDVQALLRFQMLLRQLESHGWVSRTLEAGGAPLVALQPIGTRVELDSRVLPEGTALSLSRFALLRSDAGRLVLESPRSPVRGVLHDPRIAALVATLTDAAVPDAGAAGLPEATATPALRMLTSAGLLLRAEDAAGEEDDRTLAQWAFPDLLLHARSRVGRHLGGYGGTQHLRGRFEPLPLRGPAAHAVTFSPPDLDAVAAVDPPLVRVMEDRGSVRAHDDDAPITAGQLGEFLFRTSRIKERFEVDGLELARRPYPAGGALYELEVYPLVRHCAGVDPGLYRYDGAGHGLEPVAGPGAATEALLEMSRGTALMDAQPQVVLLVAAQVGRVMWKYESMAYALVLKHVGVLYQTMYLVATAMGLAPCALGGGDSDAFATATGLDPYDEPGVGEFLLGSRPR